MRHSPPSPLRLFNRAGHALTRLGLEPVALDPERMIAAAERRSGCPRVTDPRYRESLQVLVDSANRQSTLTTFGRLFLRRAIVNRMANLFRIDAAVRARPEILRESIDRPIFIAAQPRTGTTLLHRLLAVDPRNRVPRTWEMDTPVPPPARDSYTTDPRIRRAARELRVLNWAAPSFAAIHELASDLPEECINLFANELESMWFLVGVHLPEYEQWLYRRDLVPLYRSHRRQLQLLQVDHKLDRWVLKAPMHLLGLRALLEVYPDATVIQTHRDPAQVIASEASLFLNMRSAFHTDLDPLQIGNEMVEQQSLWLDRAMNARAECEKSGGSHRFVDIHYRQLVSDPLAAVTALYEHLSIDLPEAVRGQMEQFLVQNRQHKHGVHRYALADFGLDRSRIDSLFSNYRARFVDFYAASA